MRKTLATLVLAFFAVQAIGAYLLCACGRCPVSAALGVRDNAASEHACCAGHGESEDTETGPLLRDHCGRCAHDQVPELAVAGPRTIDAAAVASQVAAPAELLAVAAVVQFSAVRRAATSARGPPVRSGLPPEIRFVRLLI